MCLVKAIQRWDPFYVDKVRQVSDVIDRHFHRGQLFCSEPVSAELGYEAAGICRVLVRRGFLEKIPGEKPGKPSVFRRMKGNWPPPDSLFAQGPVGLPYFVSSWFGYYLQQHITGEMSRIETAEDMMQLDGLRAGGGLEGEDLLADTVPSSEGQIMSRSGYAWLADTGLVDADLDLGQMNLEWVQKTGDPLFSELSRQERLLLYLIYARDMTWKDVAVYAHYRQAQAHAHSN